MGCAGKSDEEAAQCKADFEKLGELKTKAVCGEGGRLWTPDEY